MDEGSGQNLTEDTAPLYGKACQLMEISSLSAYAVLCAVLVHYIPGPYSSTVGVKSLVVLLPFQSEARIEIVRIPATTRSDAPTGM